MAGLPQENRIRNKVLKVAVEGEKQRVRNAAWNGANR